MYALAAVTIMFGTIQGMVLDGRGKHVVLISGDEEYRSEEALPQLARILAKRHGFRCTVLFAIDPKDGTINPDVNNNIPGLEALKSADLMVVFLRYRDLPDEQMRHIVEYTQSGRPIVALRTSTHAFLIPAGRTYSRFSCDSKASEGGFGREVLGETWIDHHGQHGKEGTRGIIAPGAVGHPILRGIKDGDIFGPSDVYRVRLPLPNGCTPLVLGQVTQSLDASSPPLMDSKNDPMMPVAWTRLYSAEPGKSARVFTTTMGASQDLQSEGLRRLLVNACYWAVGQESQIPPRSDVTLVGDYRPSPFKFGGARKGMRPADLVGE